MESYLHTRSYIGWHLRQGNKNNYPTCWVPVHRISGLMRLEGTSEGLLVQPPRKSCPEAYQGSFWRSSRTSWMLSCHCGTIPLMVGRRVTSISLIVVLYLQCTQDTVLGSLLPHSIGKHSLQWVTLWFGEKTSLWKGTRSLLDATVGQKLRWLHCFADELKDCSCRAGQACPWTRWVSLMRSAG